MTATHVPASIVSSSQWSSPISRREFHIHVHPHSSSTPRIVVGIALGCGGSAVKTITCFSCAVFLAEHTFLVLSLGCSASALAHRAADRVVVLDGSLLYISSVSPLICLHKSKTLLGEDSVAFSDADQVSGKSCNALFACMKEVADKAVLDAV